MFSSKILRGFLYQIALFLLLQNVGWAQPVLPDMVNVSQNGINILTWNCQYDGVKTIVVQRSSDSNLNYTTIGFVKDVKKGGQYFLDGHAKPGANWYRIKLIFGSDLNWTCNRIKVMVDSAQVAQSRVLPSNDSLQAMVAKFSTKKVEIADSAKGKIGKTSVTITTTAPLKKDSASTQKNSISLSIEVPDIEQVNAYTYIKSQYVFTNPFTGHVNIEIADAKSKIYSLDFFDNKNVKILEIPRVNETNVVLDKRNFQRVGMYKFELYKDKVKIETGYVTIY